MSALDMLAAVAALGGRRGDATDDLAAVLAAPENSKATAKATATSQAKAKAKAKCNTKKEKESTGDKKDMEQGTRSKSKTKCQPSPVVDTATEREPCRLAFASPRLDASSSESAARAMPRDSSYSSLAGMMARLMHPTSVPEAPRKRRRTAHLMASPPPPGSDEELVRALMDTLARRIDDELCDAAHDAVAEASDEDASDTSADLFDGTHTTHAKTLVIVAMNHTADALATYDDADTYETVCVAAARGAPKNASDALLLWELYRRLATGDLAGRCVVVASRSRAARAAVEVLPYLPGVTCLVAPARVDLFPTIV